MLAAVARHVDPQLCRRPATNGAIGSGAGSWLAEVRESHGSGLAGVDGDGLQYTGQGLSLAELRLLAGELPRSEVEQRLELLAEHVAQYHTTNHVTPPHRTPTPQPLTLSADPPLRLPQQDGTVFTPPLLKYLADPTANFAHRLEHLDALRAATRDGRFDASDELQRDLEFRRYEYEMTRVHEPLTYPLRGTYPPPVPTAELYQQFCALPTLTQAKAPAVVLDAGQERELHRAAQEALGLLDFLREMAAGSAGRQIVVAANDRFGRHWGIEPLMPWLQDDPRFHLVDARLSSGTSTRVFTPARPFSPQLVRKLANDQPHVVIVDGCSAAVDPASTIALSRGLRDYGSWFAAFNERRRPGEPDSSWGGAALLGQVERSEWDGFAEASWLLEEWVG
jgi:hypothetical protein